MSHFFLPLVGATSALLWLVLLLATGFNVIAVGVGLMAMLVVTGERP